MKNPLQPLQDHDRSVWLDYLRRSGKASAHDPITFLGITLFKELDKGKHHS